jgi:hypothetical protein
VARIPDAVDFDRLADDGKEAPGLVKVKLQQYEAFGVTPVPQKALDAVSKEAELVSAIGAAVDIDNKFKEAVTKSQALHSMCESTNVGDRALKLENDAIVPMNVPVNNAVAVKKAIDAVKARLSGSGDADTKLGPLASVVIDRIAQIRDKLSTSSIDQTQLAQRIKDAVASKANDMANSKIEIDASKATFTFKFDDIGPCEKGVCTKRFLMEEYCSKIKTEIVELVKSFHGKLNTWIKHTAQGNGASP